MLIFTADFNEYCGMVHGYREPGHEGSFQGCEWPVQSRLGETDQTRAKSVEQSAQPGHQDLASLLNQLPGMVYRCHYDGKWKMDFASEGAYELTGYRVEDLIHQNDIFFSQVIHPDDREDVHQKIEKAWREGKPFNITYRIRARDGSEKWVRDTGKAVSNTSDRIEFEGFITDVSEQKRSEERIQRQIRRFEGLRKVDMAITASFDLRVTLDVLLEQVINQLEVDAGDILLLDRYTNTLEYAARRGFRTAALQHTSLRLGEGFAGSAAIERRTIHIPDLTRARGGLERSPYLEAEGFITYFGVPLIAKGELEGILEIFHRSPLQPDPEWLDYLETLAGQAAIAIDNATLFKELQRSNMELNLAYDATLEGWSKALELRDQETEGHTQRVTHMTLRLARSMGFSDSELVPIYRGALLHDIGKMGIPDHILLKPGPLNPNEWEIMRQHPTLAYNLLWPIPSLRPALDIPYCHHEKWNGMGYPRGLKGEEIPLAARIFSIVDVWDALISDRPYRKAWPEDKVFEYIRKEKGRHFDPQVTEAFLALF